MRSSRLLFVLAATLSWGCELIEDCDDVGVCGDDAFVSGEGGGSQAGGDWATSEHPCQENRTDALLVEGQSLWVGCGTGTEGRGLWFSDDAGRSWSAAATEPAEAFATWRVNDVVRGADGLLYVGGIDTAGRATVATLDTTQSPGLYAESYVRGDRVGTSFQVGSVAVGADGAAIAESLTGTDLVYRSGADAQWAPLDGYTTDGESYQLLQVRASGGAFYGVGSTIIQPPTVFLPSRSPMNPTVLFEAVSLSDGSGELWGLDVTPSGLVIAVGVDQDRNVGLAFVGGVTAYDAADWALFDVSSQISGSTWLRGACASDDALVVVGERQPLRRGGALAFRSTDGGASWVNISPADGPASLTRCQLVGNTIWAAGAFGWTGALAP